MTDALIVLIGETRAGTLRRSSVGDLSFEYDDGWRQDEDAVPVSVSLPLAQRSYEGEALSAYLWGLLPDNEVIIDAWARRFEVSARSVFGLLAHVGEECAGAVQFVRAERAPLLAKARRQIRWLDESDVGARLRALRTDESAWRIATESGQFSLGGAQAKTALYFDGRRWAVPAGRTPTTHILKPGLGHLDGHAENEHFCLSLAAALDLPAARSQVLTFGDERAVVIERYDRQRRGRAIVRVHQEDCCQALGVMPMRKYESEGGPGVHAIAALLTERSRAAKEDLDTLVASLALSWAIAGTDAHAKNYSVLIGAGGTIRLAPLYDLASFLPYASHGLRKLKLAMKIGGKYRIHEIGVHAWTKLANEIGWATDDVLAHVRRVCLELPDAAADVFAEASSEGLDHPVLTTLRDAIQKRARELARLF